MDNMNNIRFTNYMKKFLIIYLFLFFYQGYSQVYNFDAKYRQAEITFIDKHIENGFIYGFIERKFIEFTPSNGFSLSNIEERLNLNDNTMSFKTTIDGSKKELSQNDLISVKVLNDEGEYINWKLMELKTVNVDGKIINLNRKAWLPIYKEDKINIFSKSVYSQQGQSKPKYGFTMIYLNNPKDNFAINPIDYNRINIFNIGKINDKLIFALKEVFKDCPEFLKKIEGDPDEVIDRYFKNRIQRKKDREVFRENSKDLSRKDRNFLEIELKENTAVEPYLKLIDEYKVTCVD
jgi:hypothetical protein